jgi:hypothetical protein
MVTHALTSLSIAAALALSGMCVAAAQHRPHLHHAAAAPLVCPAAPAPDASR